ncbi:YraN family protein [Desulfobulbus sp. US2]|nr:YraN family protein [Desulfobulbus sp. US4]MCW5207984.1 YraN family protein [Desulfobulbus sp. US2]
MKAPNPKKDPRKNSRKATGRSGEALAAQYLEQQGYIILERNYRLRIGEVDIIARDGEYLVFIEVKTRRSTRFGSPFEAVDARKQQQIVKIASAYLQGKELPVRFDVVAVHLNGQDVRIEVLKNAF